MEKTKRKPKVASKTMCFKCGNTYSAELKICPEDSTQLVPIGLPALIPPLTDKYDILECNNDWNSKSYVLQDKASGELAQARVFFARTEIEREKERFLRLVPTMSALDHPFIPHLLEHGNLDDGKPYILFEFKEGISLEELVNARGRLEIADLCRILIPICDALSHAHKRNIFHLDLSFEVIVVEELDEHMWNSSLHDFGKGAPLMHSDNKKVQLTEDNDLFGTPRYMAPEQVQQKPVDARSNIYSMGCIIYHALKGKAPFEDNNWMLILMQHGWQEPEAVFGSKKLTELETSAAELVAKAMCKQPEYRHASAKDLKEDLAKLLALALADKD